MVRAEQGRANCVLMPMFADTSQGCALRRRGEGEEEGKAAHINHMKLLLDIRARLQSWTGLGDQQCGAVRCDAMRCDCDSMPVERWDQLTCEVCCECGLA